MANYTSFSVRFYEQRPLEQQAKCILDNIESKKKQQYVINAIINYASILEKNDNGDEELNKIQAMLDENSIKIQNFISDKLKDITLAVPEHKEDEDDIFTSVESIKKEEIKKPNLDSNVLNFLKNL